MDYRELGRTGRRVSAVGFGGSAVGIQGYIDGLDRDSDSFRREAKAACNRSRTTSAPHANREAITS